MSDSHRQGDADEPVHVPGIEFDATEAALKAEQDERDGMIDDRSSRPWEEFDAGPLFAAAAVAADLVEYVESFEALLAAGLDPDILTASVELNVLTGSVVIGALQLAGVLVPSLRPVIDGVLDGIDKARPLATQEQLDAIDAMAKKVAGDLLDEQMRRARAAPPEFDIDFHGESN